MEVLASYKIQDSNELIAFRKFRLFKNKFNTIVFKSSSKEIVLNNIYKIDFVGGSRSQTKKADIVVYYDLNKKFNISLKLKSFVAWESADSLVGDSVAEKILEYLMDQLGDGNTGRKFKIKAIVENGKVRYSIVRKGSNNKINLAYRCNESDCNHVVFGTDIIGSGAVITYDFRGRIGPDQDGIWTISADEIIEEVNELPEKYYPYFQITSAKYRRNLFRFPGIRVQAKPKNSLGNSVIMPSIR